MFTPILPRNTQRKHERVGIFHACNLCLFTLWMDDFLRLFWASHVRPALSWSVHGHNSTDALWGPGMLRLCGGCFSCLCNSSVLLCLSLRMAFPSAGDPSGTPPLYPLRCSTCPFAGKQRHLSSQEVEHSVRSFRCSPKKTPAPPSPHQYLYIYVHESRGQW